ncbi:MAG TPA: hypothetical protein VKG23_09875 [Thermoanaerobaculia bacterium]|nr:hypothetical protein [Thermoanaerobaculia bacterium]
MLRSARTSPRRRETELLLLIVAVSWALRIVLVMSGGQDYWPDEARYGRSRAAVAALSRGDAAAALRALDEPEHLLFGVLGVVPAAAERAFGASSKIPAAFFATFSAASVLLLWVLVGRLGGDEPVRLLAAFFFAASATQFYYARHLLPYDAAMALGLAALVVGFRSPYRRRDSVVCGLLAAAAALTYNGYGLLSAFALLAHAAREPRSVSLVARRVIFWGAGFLAPLAAVFAVDAALGGSLGGRVVEFSGSVVQGSFAEGWSLPFAYFWHAEHLIAVLWAIAFVWSLVRRSRGDRSETLRLGLAGVVFVYGGLVVLSVVLRKIVVYGRLARPIVPFACMLAALMVASLARRAHAGRLAAAGVLGGVALQAAANFATPLVQMFPAEFLRLAEGSAPPAPRGALGLLYVGHIYPKPAPPPPDCEIVVARRHPLQFLPYQYEGYAPAARAALRATDIRMRLVVCPAEPAAP